MKYEIKGDTLPVVLCYLEGGEKMINEGGSMSWMSPNMKMETTTNGGVGTVPGILLGVLVFGVLKICLQYMQVNPAYTYIAQGIVIVVAVALDLRKYLAKK